MSISTGSANGTERYDSRGWKKIPASMLRQLMEQAFHLLLTQDPVTSGKLSALKGTVIKLQCLSPFFGYSLVIRENQINVLAEADNMSRENSVNTVTAETLSDFFALIAWLSQAPASETYPHMFKSKDIVFENIKISGDNERIQTFFTILRQSEFDFDGWMANYTGHGFAHIAGHGMRSIMTLGQQQLTRWQSYLSDYLQEEVSMLPPGAAFLSFKQANKQLQEQVRHLEGRLERIMGKKKDSTAGNMKHGRQRDDIKKSRPVRKKNVMDQG